MTYRRAAAAAALAALLGGQASAQPAGRCTRETLDVRGTPVTFSYCVTAMGRPSASHALPVQAAESFSSPHGTFNRQSSLQFIAGMPDSRVIEDVPLGAVGLAGTLHVTLVLHDGLIHVDSAILTPGAVTIK